MEICIEGRARIFLDRAVDRPGQAFDFMGSEHCDLPEVRSLLGLNSLSDQEMIDKTGADLAGLQSENVMLNRGATGRVATIGQLKLVSNIRAGGAQFITRIIAAILS